LPSLDPQRVEVIVPRLRAVRALIEAAAASLSDGFVVEWPIDTLESRINDILTATTASDEWALKDGESVECVLAQDGVVSEVSSDGDDAGSASGSAPGSVPVPKKTPATGDGEGGSSESAPKASGSVE